MNDQQQKPSGSTPGIGIDYGTSNSAAAVFDGERIRLVPLESHSAVMPSATYIDREFKLQTGQAAIDQYIESNMGRTVELSAEILGEGRTSTGQIGSGGLPEEAETETIYGQSVVDAGQKGRLFRGIKRLLGNRNTPRLMVFDRPFRLVALITPLLLRIRDGLNRMQQNGELPKATYDHACIGHPVNFEGADAQQNIHALTLLAESYRHAEFTRQSYYPEPVAAALSYLHEYPQPEASTILAFDFGGGTLDLCVLVGEASRFRVVSTHGVGLGGDYIDQILFSKLVFPLLGKGERWRRPGEDREIETQFPFEEYEDKLLNWAISYLLNQNRYTSQLMHRIDYDDAAAHKFRRLYDLIKNNYSYLIFQSLKELKAKLSTEELAQLDIPEIDIDLQISRTQFEELIEDVLIRVENVIDEILHKARLEPEQIDLVIKTGGSSQIPAVINILSERFPGKVVEHNPFTSVAAGLAIADYYDYGNTRLQDSATSIG